MSVRPSGMGGILNFLTQKKTDLDKNIKLMHQVQMIQIC